MVNFKVIHTETKHVDSAYRAKDCVLENSDFGKDLGVTVDKQLNFHSETDNKD